VLLPRDTRDRCPLCRSCLRALLHSRVTRDSSLRGPPLGQHRDVVIRLRHRRLSEVHFVKGVLKYLQVDNGRVDRLQVAVLLRIGITVSRLLALQLAPVRMAWSREVGERVLDGVVAFSLIEASFDKLGIELQLHWLGFEDLEILS